MRARIVPVLAYVAAGLTLVVAVCVPFVLFGAFSGAVAHAGLHIDPVYSGGTVARTIDRGAYRISVYQPVRPRALQQVEPFVQLSFAPASALPSRVSDEIDLDGDGRPDVRVTFTVPVNLHQPLRGEVIALNPKYKSLVNVAGDSFSRLLVRSGDYVVVRVPLS